MRRRKRILAKVHVGKPIPPRGWKLPVFWRIVAKCGAQRLFLNGGPDLNKARELANSLLSAGPWEVVDIYEQERINPRKL